MNEYSVTLSLKTAVKIGMAVAAVIEPTDTVRVIATSTKNSEIAIKHTRQSITKNIPAVVATPLPPLKEKYKGYMCPMMQNSPARYAKYSGFMTDVRSVLRIFDKIGTIRYLPSKHATTPLSRSHMNVKIAGFLPTVRSTLVIPALPLPC